MIGSNLPETIATADDARALAAAIHALRAEVECIEAKYKPDLDVLASRAAVCRSSRDLATAPLTERADELRKALADWLQGDPDMQLKDGDRVVATLSRKAGKPQIHAEQVPDAFKSMQPDMGRINLALAAGERVPGVSVPITTILRVL